MRFLLFVLILTATPVLADGVFVLRAGSERSVPQQDASEIERLALGLLRSSSYEAPHQIATQSRWQRSAYRTHIRIAFSHTRTLSFAFSTVGPVSTHHVRVDELLIPFSPTDYALVRSGGHVQAFAKFSSSALLALRSALEFPHQ